MAENKKSVLLYCDIIHTVEELDDVDAGLLFKHYLRYINDQNPEPPSKLIKIVFEPIKQNLKRDLKKWEEKSLKNSESARIRWDKNNANASERTERNANYADKDKVKDKVIVNDNVSDIKEKTLTLGFGDLFFSVNSKYLHEKKYIVRGVAGLREYMELNNSILDQPERHESFMKSINGDVFNEFMHVKNKYKHFLTNKNGNGYNFKGSTVSQFSGDYSEPL